MAAPLIVTWTVQPVLTSALNAQRKGAVLLGGGVITIIVNLSLDVVLGSLIGVTGIAMATVLTSIIVVLFMGHRLKRAEPAFSARVVWRTLIVSSLAVMPAVILLGVPIWSGFVGSDLIHRVFALVFAGSPACCPTTSSRDAWACGGGRDLGFGRGTMRRLWRRVRRA